MPRRRASLRLRSEIIGLKRDQATARSDADAAVPTENQQLDQNHPLRFSTSPLLLTPSPHYTSASAAAKLILCGEHAVVYGRPAIALPLAGIRARADVADAPSGNGIVLHARDLRRRWRVANDPNGPLSQLITNVLSYLLGQAAPAPYLRITISSTIPIASGMGSGAAVATAIVRALAAHLGRQIAPEEVSALVYASEQRFHGTPSGIDNTVIAYEQPIWFVRQQANDEGQVTKGESEPSSFVVRPSSPFIEPIAITSPFMLLIGETGVRSPTRLPVGDVRRRWQAAPARYEALFDQVGTVVTQVRAALENDISALGSLLSQNHWLLQQIGVSSPELDRLVAAALAAGALGAKLSGAGWGGVMLALVTQDTRERVRVALQQAGAKRVSATVVSLFQPASLAGR